MPASRRSKLSKAIAGVTLWLACGVALAQDYPAKTVRLIVAVAPGGGADIMARQLARRLSEHFNQQVVIDNRPGAGTVIGTEWVAKSAPDGYTLILQVNALAANHTLHKKLPYDTLRDFAPVVLVAATPNVPVVHPSLPVKNVQEFVAFAKARRNQVNYASTGLGAAAAQRNRLMTIFARKSLNCAKSSSHRAKKLNKRPAE